MSALRFLCSAWVVAFLLAAIVIPLARVIAHAGALGPIFDPAVLAVARFTVRQASLSTALALAIGVPLGMAVARAMQGRAMLQSVFRTLLIVPFTVPSVVAAAGWVAWLSMPGALVPAYSLQAVLAAHVFLNAPWIALLLADARSQVPQAELEASSTLGATPFRAFRTLVWPRITPALLAGGAQVFGLCATSFVLVLILGGGPPVETLETGIYARIRYGDLDVAGATAFAFWQLVITLVPWLVALRARGAMGAGVAQRSEARAYRASKRGGWSWVLVAAVAALVFWLPYREPLTSLASFPKGESAGEIMSALALSAKLALATAVLAVGTALAVFVALPRRRLARTALAVAVSLPAGISALVLGLGFVLAYGGAIDPVEGSLLAVVVLQAVLLLPLAFRSLWPVHESRPTPLLDAATTLGASSVQAWRWIEWPRWRRPIASVFALVAGLALGEVAAASLLVGSDPVPLPVLVSRWMGQYRFEDAQAGAALILVASAAIVALATASPRGRGEAR